MFCRKGDEWYVFHEWTPWSEPFTKEITMFNNTTGQSLYTYKRLCQKRKCSICGEAQERRVIEKVA